MYKTILKRSLSKKERRKGCAHHDAWVGQLALVTSSRSTTQGPEGRGVLNNAFTRRRGKGGGGEKKGKKKNKKCSQHCHDARLVGDESGRKKCSSTPANQNIKRKKGCENEMGSRFAGMLDPAISFHWSEP